MTIKLLSDLLHDIVSVSASAETEVKGLALDSREVSSGDLFFACDGTKTSGKHFIQQAIQRGAAAVLVEQNASESELTFFFEDAVPVFPVPMLHTHVSNIAARFYDYPANDLQIIGVTGTNGKTSCSHFIAAALHQLAIPCGIIGTLGSGVYGDLHPLNLTTPDAITLQKLFSDFRTQGIRYVAMEVSSHSLDQGRVNAVPFSIAIFTNLTRDHLDYHGTMEAYGAAKKKLFDHLPLQYAVVNADDPFGKTLLESLALKKSTFAYGIHSNDVLKKVPESEPLVPEMKADNVKLTLSGIEAHVVSPWGEGELKTELMGFFNLSNLLAVLTTLCLLEIPFETGLICLANLKPVPGRMETATAKNRPLVVVDYSHTPDALENALMTLKLHCTGQLYCVFGCGGDRDRGKRAMMAAIAEQYADCILVTDDNPRTEDPKQIITDILQGFSTLDKVTVQHDRSKAIAQILEWAKAGDCVLIAGKGAETYQQIGNQTLPFSDIEKVWESL